MALAGKWPICGEPGAPGRVTAAAAGFDDAALYTELQRPLAERRLPLAPLLREEGLAAFQAWEANTDRQPY